MYLPTYYLCDKNAARLYNIVASLFCTGNINQLVLALQPYRKTLLQSGGLVPEFVNPKYKDSSRTTFKAPTRIECMMQDIGKSLPADAKKGFTLIN